MQRVQLKAYLVIATMLVQKRYDGFDVSLFDKVQSLWALLQDTM